LSSDLLSQGSTTFPPWVAPDATTSRVSVRACVHEMTPILSLLRRLSRNDVAFLMHRLILRGVYGNRIQRLSNRDMFNRPEWFWGEQAVPNLPLTVPDSSGGLDDGARDRLAADLVEAFHAGQGLDPSNGNYSPLWSTIIDRSAPPVLRALRDRDPVALRAFLEGMFPSPTLWGIGYGDLGLEQGRRFASFLILGQLVGLAESLGVVRTECPEQGEIGHALRGGVEALLSEVERAIGIRVDFPRIGGAYGIEVGGRLLDLQTPGHLYAARRFRGHLAATSDPHACEILEIGAGFGGTCHWFQKLAAPRRYVILDLALTNVYQGWFLANAFGRDQVGLYPDFVREGAFDRRRLWILPVNSQEKFAGQRFDGVLNQDSFPEMPAESVRGYLRLAAARLRPGGILFSMNQEAFSPMCGQEPPWVAALATGEPSLVRRSRELSWVRRGYVEEVYQAVS